MSFILISLFYTRLHSNRISIHYITEVSSQYQNKIYTFYMHICFCNMKLVPKCLEILLFLSMRYSTQAWNSPQKSEP